MHWIKCQIWLKCGLASDMTLSTLGTHRGRSLSVLLAPKLVHGDVAAAEVIASKHSKTVTHS